MTDKPSKKPSRLLSDIEPKAFELINENLEFPLVITCDHASNQIPHKLEQLNLQEPLLQKHIAYDIGAKQVAIALANKFKAPLLLANYSRLVVDLNRHLHDSSLMPEVSDCIAIPGNSNLHADHRQQRIDEIFMPYHQQHRQLVAHAQSLFVRPIILSIHSFTPVMQDVQRPWHYGVLWDQDADLAADLLQGLKQIDGRVIGDNQPYHANNPRGYSLDEHAAKRGVEIAIIEIRQDLIAHASGQQQIANELFDVIAPMVDQRRINSSNLIDEN